MYNELSIYNKVYVILIKNTLLDMTINNPIFIFALITVIWFIPGIIVRRFNELKTLKKKEKNQADAINKLYPNSKDWLNSLMIIYFKWINFFLLLIFVLNLEFCFVKYLNTLPLLL